MGTASARPGVTAGPDRASGHSVPHPAKLAVGGDRAFGRRIGRQTTCVHHVP